MTNYAQTFPVFTFTKSKINNLLPSLSTMYIFKDSEGFVWISTLKGLCRYDGNSIKIFKQDKNNPTSIGGIAAGYICEDKEGNIWASLANGSISKYNKCNNKFATYTHYYNNKNDSVKFDYGRILCSSNNDIVYGHIDGYNNAVYDKNINRFKLLSVDTTNDGFNHKQASNGLVGVMVEVDNGKDLYLVSVNGLFSYDVKTKLKKRITKSSLYTPMDLYKDNIGQLWLGEWDGGLNIVNPVTGARQNIVPNKTIGAIDSYKDINGKMWIVASEFKTGSIVIIDPITKKYTSQVIKTSDQSSPNALAGKMLTSFNGKILFTSINGIYEMTESNTGISNVFTYKLGAPVDVYYDNLVRSGVELANGDYIFSKLGYNGILRYDNNLQLKKTIKNYTYNGKTYELDVRSFLKLGENKYLLTGPAGIALYDDEKIVPLNYISSNPANNSSILRNVREALPIDAENYWIRLTGGGIVQYNITTKTITKTYTTAKDNIPLETIISIQYDGAGNLWAVSFTHVFKYNKKTKEFEDQSINRKHKPITHMRKCCFDKQQNLWVTGLGGLLHYDFKTNKETIYSTENGLSDDDVFSVLPYDSNSILITQKTCITHFDFTTKNFTVFNNKNGMPYSTNEYDAALVLDKNKYLLIGNSGVISKINVANYLANAKQSSNIVITQVEGSNTDEEIVIDKGIKKVDLHFENFPTNILFSVINYSISDDISYYYRYSGKDSSWIKCANGIVPVNTITPGTYTIEVTASIAGKFVDAKDQITFTIIPRWFETLWFKIIAGVLSLFFIFLLYRWRIKTAKKSQMQQTEIQRLAAQEYKTQLELSQISNYFSTSLSKMNNIDDVLWDVAKNLIGKLGFEDCMIYTWNADKTKLIQKAGYGPKGSIEEIEKQPFDVVYGQGVVGYVAQKKESVIIADTRLDKRYRMDEMNRLSEICVPIIYQNELLGIIDSEHHQLKFFNTTHLQLLNTIAGYIANKIVDIKNNEALFLANQKLNEVQLDALRSQMNPHFIFNCLNSIKLYTSQNKNEAAADYLTKFSKLIRKSLENSRSRTISLADELETLELYIQLEGMRFKEKLKYKIILSPDVDSSFIEIPPMLIQPYVENAIWHGLMQKEEGGSITIHIDKLPAENVLVIVIKDDGIGREKAALLKSKSSTTHKSFGTKVTDERVALINKIYNTNAKIVISDRIENNTIAGTIVTIQIPFE